MNSRRFSRWSAEPSTVTAEAALVQVKVVEGLLTYPKGRSAMVYYGVLAPCSAPRVAALLTRLAADFQGQQLVWRFLASGSVEGELEQLLQRFVTRFGAAPKAMTLQISAEPKGGPT